MARTDQTARKSTGGKEPWKDLHEKPPAAPPERLSQNLKWEKFVTLAGSSQAVSIPSNPQVIHY
jgi:hypothetical protein